MLEPILAKYWRRICLGLALRARVRYHLRQYRQRARRRPDEEGHHLESAGLIRLRPRSRAGPIPFFPLPQIPDRPEPVPALLCLPAELLLHRLGGPESQLLLARKRVVQGQRFAVRSLNGVPR